MKTLFKIFLNIDDHNIKEEENFKSYELVATFDTLKLPSKDELSSILNTVSNRDEFLLCIKTDYVSDIHLHSNSDIDNFLNDLSDLIDDKEQEEKYHLKLNISKSIKNNTISIYNLKSFEQFLISQGIETLDILNKYLTEKEYIMLECQHDEIDEFYTNSIYFINKNKDIQQYLVDRKDKVAILNKRNEICSFLNAAQLYRIPDDFNFIKLPDGFNSLKSLFDKLKLIVSISFISNISSIDFNTKSVYYKIVGYKTIEESIIFESIDSSFVAEIYRTYLWIYNDGNLSDKIGLARNVISMQVDNNSIFLINTNSLNSIKSSYEIYLKENVNKYMQLRADISENILNLLSNLGGLIDELVGVILKFIIGGLSAIFTVIVMNSITSGNLVDVITGDLAIICIGAIIILNIILLYIILPNIKDKFNRYKNEFDDMKETYRYILNSEDLDEIFNKDKFITSREKAFTKDLEKYMKLWFVLQLILVATILIA